MTDKTQPPSSDELAAKLEAKNCLHWPGDPCTRTCLRNPDGPEASATLQSTQRQLTDAREALAKIAAMPVPCGIVKQRQIRHIARRASQ